MNKKIILPFVAILVLAVAMVGAASADDDEVTTVDKVEIRGQVLEEPVITFEWNETNFAAFWYDLDDNLATENLTIDTTVGTKGPLTSSQRVIDEDVLTYVTEPAAQAFEVCEELKNGIPGKDLRVDGAESEPSGEDLDDDNVTGEEETCYNIVGWMAEKYIGVGGRADTLAELLVEFEDDDKKTLSTGEEWDLGGGFSLVAQQIDLEGNKVWLQLNKNGKEIDSKIIGKEGGNDQDMLYVYTQDDVGDEDDVPIFVAYVDAVFRGTDSNIVQLMYVWLMSDETIEIDDGDEFGELEVEEANKDTVRLQNDNTITLSADDTVNIFEDVKFKVADDENVLRFYPFAEKTIGEGGEGEADDDDEVETPENDTDANVTPTAVVTPTAEEVASPVVTATDDDTTAPTETATDDGKTPGFEAVFAIAGLLAVAYLVLRQRE